MKLHHHPLSSYSRKAVIGIGLRGDDIELVELDAMGGALRQPAFLAMNPFGKMPVLETPDGPVYESTSILEYLELEHGPRVLIPETQARQARHFDRVGDLYLLDPVGKFFWDKSQKTREATLARMSVAWQVWADALADGRPFVLGDAITLADLSAAVAFDYARTEDLSVPDAIQRYGARLHEHSVLADSRDRARPFVEATRAHRHAT